MRIAVAGGTGTVGLHVVEALKVHGHEPVVLSRATGIDLAAGTGIDEALRGTDAVIDVTSTGSQSAKAGVAFFGSVTRNLLAAERRAGIGHHIALSIIGAAKMDAGYYAGKAAQERILMALPGGWSILRAAQFHEFAQQMATRMRLAGVHAAPVMNCQPVAASEVGEALAEIAVAAPRGLDTDLAGPREEKMTDMVREYLRAVGDKGPVINVSLPGAFGRGLRDGSILPGPDARLGTQTFAEWIAVQASAKV
ncbi:SDR family oxidoreductase [Planctomonas sp. JC2975]|uniref:SDR family oxidoreductase n=1 Tax=Planctomonas sp. JC2975 TaxID=2729626 RepID=UPI001474961B|nr:SDR family oxidoreductase [Planctomonas sp. JC2975]NNC12286.1 SDR family oxidoreductase [Planctomonas sp. JC2975]